MSVRRVGRRFAVAALATVAAVGCTPQELNRWGAQMRGAPVTESYRGHPYYVVGPAQYPFEDCVWSVATFEPWVGEAVRNVICSVNRTFVEGEYGYRRN